MIDLIEALDDPNLLQPWFAGESWRPWRAVLKAACGHRLDHDEARIFRQVAQRDPPRRRVRELWVGAGRRAGKDSIASALAAHAAGFVDYGPYLRPGEVASVMCLAVDKPQARIVLRYSKAYFDEVDMLRPLVMRETAEGLELTTRAEFSVLSSNYRTVRGRSIALAILDECAFWRDEGSASPDVETYVAIVPGMATLPNALLVGMSSPYRKGGLLYQKWRDHFGKPDDDVLFIQAASRALNPNLPQRVVDEAMERDPAAARAEWLGSFRDDVDAFLPREVVERAVDRNVTVRPPVSNVRYVGFADASSGTGSDSFGAVVAHRQGDYVIVDLVHEIRPPFNPQSAVSEVSSIFSSYGIKQIIGDRWAPGFVSDAFQANGITYKYSERDRSQIYLEALPVLVSGRVRLLDNARLINQLATLERRTSPSGRDRVDHPGGSTSHDDVANAACGAIVACGGTSEPGFIGYMRWRSEGEPRAPAAIAAPLEPPANLPEVAAPAAVAGGIGGETREAVVGAPDGFITDFRARVSPATRR